jgi:hypothetical protein
VGLAARMQRAQAASRRQPKRGGFMRR